MNSKVLSLKAVIVTAMGVSGLYFWVRALKSLQNAIKLRRYCPSAGPTGGAGRALPAGTVRRIVAATGRRVSISLRVDIDGYRYSRVGRIWRMAERFLGEKWERVYGGKSLDRLLDTEFSSN